MEDINEMPEVIRQHISKLIDEATLGIKMDDRFKFMVVSLSFQMYKMGYLEAYNLMSKTIEVQKGMMK